MRPGIGPAEILAELKSRGVWLKQGEQFTHFNNTGMAPEWLWKAFTEHRHEILRLLRAAYIEYKGW